MHKIFLLLSKLERGVQVDVYFLKSSLFAFPENLQSQH